jgi:hypothetical protein
MEAFLSASTLSISDQLQVLIGLGGLGVELVNKSAAVWLVGFSPQR